MNSTNCCIDRTEQERQKLAVGWKQDITLNVDVCFSLMWYRVSEILDAVSSWLQAWYSAPTILCLLPAACSVHHCSCTSIELGQTGHQPTGRRSFISCTIVIMFIGTHLFCISTINWLTKCSSKSSWLSWGFYWQKKLEGNLIKGGGGTTLNISNNLIWGGLDEWIFSDFIAHQLN